MKEGDTKTVKLYRVNLGKGRGVVVPNVKLEMYFVNGEWEECISCSEHRRVEVAIEKKYPGWFHRITKGGKHIKNCPACKRQKLEA